MTVGDGHTKSGGHAHLWMHSTRMSSCAHTGDDARGRENHVVDTSGKRYRPLRRTGRPRQDQLAEAAAEQARELAPFPVRPYAHPETRLSFTTGDGKTVETA